MLASVELQSESKVGAIYWVYAETTEILMRQSVAKARTPRSLFLSDDEAEDLGVFLHVEKCYVLDLVSFNATSSSRLVSVETKNDE